MSSGQFINPPQFGTTGDYAGDLSFAVDSTLKIKWTGAPSLATLWLFKDGDAYNCTEFNLSKTYCTPILLAFQNENEYDWIVQTYDSNYTSTAPIYYMVIKSNPPNSSTATGFTSHYFNILPASQIQPSSTTTTSSSTTTTITATTSSSSSTSTTSAAITNSASPSQAAFSGLSTATKAAIGASVGIGVPIVATLLVIAIILFRKNHRKNETRRHTTPKYSNVPTEVVQSNAPKAWENVINEHVATGSVQELSSSQQRQPHASELSAEYPRR